MSRRRALFFAVLRWSGLPWLLRRTAQRRKVTVLTYHNPSPERAAAHFRALRRRYRVISLRDLVRALRDDRWHELPPRALVVTFDDGWSETALLEPVARRLRIPVTVFLCSGIAGTRRRFWFAHPMSVATKERLKTLPNRRRLEELAALGFRQEGETPPGSPAQALSTEEIDRLGAWIDFQGHTVFHPCLPRCTDEEARREIEECRQDLERRFGLDVFCLAYPNGEYGDREAELARAAGYRCAVTTDHGFNAPGADPWRLRRVSINDEAGVAEALVQASGLWGFLRPRMLGALRRLGYARPGA